MKSKLYKVDKKFYRIIDTKDDKICLGEDYNFRFSKKNGAFVRFGKTLEDDPSVAPFPEIADIEVTTICCGIPSKEGTKSPCKFCYKSNTPKGINMSFETFKAIVDRFPKSVCQIAFGADSECSSNPDIFKMMEYARSSDIVPNITVANISDEVADKLVKVVGAVAVSRYDNKDICYDSVKKLTDRGLAQTNIHIMVSEETYDNCMETIKDRLTDERLSKMNAIVLLSLKQKGRGVGFTRLSDEKFANLVNFAFENNVLIGFDSCSCNKFLSVVKNHKMYNTLAQLSEPCESSCFSLYINAEGKYFPCSFCEQVDGWDDGLDVVKSKDFIEEIWMNPQTEKFREKLLNNNRNCPIFDV